MLQPLIRPIELKSGRDWKLADGTTVSTDDVYAMFVAARDGDFPEVKRLVAQNPQLAVVEYNYTPPIHFAVREGHREITEFLLDHGADVAYRSYPFQESLLMFAEDRGHADVADVLKSRISRRFAMSAGMQDIVTAADKGDLAAVQMELAHNPSLARASNETGDTPLHRAAKNQYVDVVEALLAAGADVDAIRGDGYRPIHCALMPNWSRSDRAKTERIVEMLLSHGARYTPFIAAMRGDAAFVRSAVERDSSLVNFEDDCHQRVLSAAVRKNLVELIAFLLERGADPTLPEEGAPRGHSLWTAVNAGHHEIARMLLARGADPNGEVESSGTPMNQATAKRDERMIELLRKHGGRLPRSEEQERVGKLIEESRLDEAEQILRANPQLIHDEKAGWGDGILAGPAHDGRNDVIAMFLRLGAKVPTVSKWAPYYYFKHEATARFLLENGMDPNHMNWHRFTLLHHMAAAGELAKAVLLIDYGADIDAIDDEYLSTPLGVAARWGRTDVVRMLLQRGADANKSGAAWSTPLAWAERNGHREIVQILRSTA